MTIRKKEESFCSIVRGNQLDQLGFAGWLPVFGTRNHDNDTEIHRAPHRKGAG